MTLFYGSVLGRIIEQHPGKYDFKGIAKEVNITPEYAKLHLAGHINQELIDIDSSGKLYPVPI